MTSISQLGANNRSMNGLNSFTASSITTGDIIANTLEITTSGITPLIVPLTTANSNIANTAFVQGAILTAAANYMDLTTNQTVATGIKTFTALPQSTAVPTLGNELVNKTFTDATYVDFVNNETIGGIKTFTNAIVATQIEGPTDSNIVVEAKGTGDVILKTGVTNRITCADTGAITIAGSSGQPMNITTTGILTLRSASNTAINIGDNQTSGEINIGTATLRTGSINIGTGADSVAAKTINIGNSTQAVGALNLKTRTITVGGSNCVSISADATTNSIQGTTVNIKTTATSGSLSLGTAMTSGNIDIGTAASSTTTFNIGTGTGIKNLNIGGTATTVNLIGSSITCNTVLPTSTLTPTLGTELVTKTFTDATYVSLTGAQSISGIKNFVSVPECATGATTANQLVNKTTLDTAITTAATAYAKLADANAFTNTNTFNSFLPTSTISATTANELVNKTTLDTAITTAATAYAKLADANAFTNTNTFNSFLPTSTISATTGNELVNKTTLDTAITTAATAYAKLAIANAFTNTNTFNSFLPTSTLTPTLGPELVTKTFTDATYVDFTNTETISGAKTFSSTTGITIKNGAGAQTGTIAQDLTTLTITGVTGDVSIKPALDFNIVTGTGKNINISAPSTASLPSTMTITTGTTNASSYIELVTSGVQLRTKASQPALLLSGAFTTANAWLFYRDGTATAAINRMDSRNAGDTCHLEVAAGSNIVLTQNTSTFNSDVRLIQTTIPATVNTQLGYSVEATSAEFTFSNGVIGNVQTLALPSKGVWLVISNISSRTTGGAGTVLNRLLVVSLANNNTTSIGTLRYFEESDDSVGSNAIRFVETITGIVTVTAATNIYVNGLFNLTGLVAYATATSSFTRIG